MGIGSDGDTISVTAGIGIVTLERQSSIIVASEMLHRDTNVGVSRIFIRSVRSVRVRCYEIKYGRDTNETLNGIGLSGRGTRNPLSMPCCLAALRVNWL